MRLVRSVRFRPAVCAQRVVESQASAAADAAGSSRRRGSCLRMLCCSFRRSFSTEFRCVQAAPCVFEAEFTVPPESPSGERTLYAGVYRVSHCTVL